MLTTPLTTPLTELLGIDHPILSAPMGDTAGARLAAAVSAAGGLGMVGGGYADPGWLRRELAELGDARFGVGFITFALDERPETLHIALDAAPVAVQLSFGDPRPYADDVHAAGALLICGVQTDDEVRIALEAGADVLVAQGRDAGGHGKPVRGTMALVPSVVDRAGGVPVVAAGGIADGRGLAAALVLGAAGVAMGTRFLASSEAISTPAEQRGVLGARADDTVRTVSVDEIRGPAWPLGYDGRIVRNRLVDRFDAAGGDAAALAALREDLAASAPDDYTLRPLWTGEGVDLIDRTEPAASIVAGAVERATQILRDLGDLAGS